MKQLGQIFNFVPLFISVTESQGAGEQLQSYRGASCEKTQSECCCPPFLHPCSRDHTGGGECSICMCRSWFPPASHSPVGPKHWMQIWLTPTHVYSIILYQSKGCSWTILHILSFDLFVSQGSIYTSSRACSGLTALWPQPHYTATVCLQRGVRYSDGLAGRVVISLRDGGHTHTLTHTHTHTQ